MLHVHEQVITGSLLGYAWHVLSCVLIDADFNQPS